MNSSDRVKTTIGHKEPDRVPMHINASPFVVESLFNRLRVRDEKCLLQALGIDIFDTRGIDLHSGIAPEYVGPPHRLLKPGKEWGGNIMALWNIQEYEKDSSHGKVIEIQNPPLSAQHSTVEWEEYSWPDVDWFSFADFGKDLNRFKNFSIMASGGSIFQHASYLIGLDNQLIDLLASPEKALYILDKIFDFYYEYYSRMFETAGDKIDIFALADDFGTQTSLLIGDDLFDQYFSPRIRKMADLAHRFDISFLLHTCGNVESLIPRFIELGVDVLDPIQPESMDPGKIKKKFGNDICLRGGISSQQVLAHGTVREVMEEVKQKLDILMPGGGYIFSPGHPVIQTDIPIENIITMYKTAYDYGRY